MRTNVYVDGFNLYYGSLKGTAYKWLDPDALCQRLLPRNEVHRIRYFTAMITAGRATRTVRRDRRPTSVRLQLSRI